MKKTILAVSLICGISGAFAQDLTSKKGEPILPEAGDWAISMSADPIFTYLGNAFNGSQNHAGPNTNFLGNQTIIGKKFIDEKSAYRAIVRVGFINVTLKNLVKDDAQNGMTINFPDQQGQVQDKLSLRGTNVGLGVGKEWRRGKTRLQGYYGADAMVWVSAYSAKYKYGNIMSESNVASTTGGTQTTTPTTTVWVNPDSVTVGPAAARTLKKSDGIVLGIGVRGFIGAEYFILPKISIGAEYGWGLGFQVQAKGKELTQAGGGSPNSVAEIQTETAGRTIFGADTDINRGNIFGFGNAASGNASLKVTFHF
ncbi:MAG TPA: hypothetical protein VFF27_10160 [Bacteroidia bacterium]|nr:hypothetical protein [Bacteroidia bacterium]